MITVDEPELAIDTALVDALNDAFDADSIPPELSAFALDAIKWRVLDDELAALTFDSSTSELVGIRGVATQRVSLRFEGRGISVSVSLSDASIVASIEPPQVYDCLIEGPHVVIVANSDENGEIAVDECPLPLRLVVETPLGRLISPWMTG